jgi:hypothetical protein
MTLPSQSETARTAQGPRKDAQAPRKDRTRTAQGPRKDARKDRARTAQGPRKARARTAQGLGFFVSIRYKSMLLVYY